jgi:hypothetical protein
LSATGRPDARLRSGLCQFASAPRNRVPIQARDLSDALVTAMPQSLGFETGIESLLLFIECAQKEIELPM